MENKLDDRKIKKPEDTEKVDNKPPKDRPSGMDDGFKEAISYFGPRLATLILGGTDAMAVTDKVLSGYEQAKLDRIRAEREEAMTPYQRESLRLRGQELDLAKKSQGLRKDKEGRLTRKDDFQRGLKQRLSDKEVKDISVMDDGNRIIGEIEDLFNKGTVQKNLGPYASRIEGASEAVPGVDRDEDFTRMQQLVGINLADYVKSISGAQVSEQEAQRLLKNLPTLTDKPKAFKVKLEQFKKEFKEARSNYLKNIGVQKKNADKFLNRNTDKDSPAPVSGAGLSPEELKELQELEELEKQGKL